jgi:hypothetical protein
MNNENKTILKTLAILTFIVFFVIGTIFLITRGENHKESENTDLRKNTEGVYTSDYLPKYYNRSVGEKVIQGDLNLGSTELNSIGIYKDLRSFTKLAEKGEWGKLYDRLYPGLQDLLPVSRADFIQHNKQKSLIEEFDIHDWENPFDSNLDYTNEEAEEIFKKNITFSDPIVVNDDIIIVVTVGESLEEKAVLLFEPVHEQVYLAPQTYNLVTNFTKPDSHSNSNLFLSQRVNVTYCVEDSKVYLCAETYLCSNNRVKTSIVFMTEDGAEYESTGCSFDTQRDLGRINSDDIEQIQVKHTYIENLQEKTEVFTISDVIPFTNIRRYDLAKISEGGRD